MKETRFLPPAQWRERIAPTEYDETLHMLRGTCMTPREAHGELQDMLDCSHRR